MVYKKSLITNEDLVMEENELVPRTMRLDNGVRLGDGQPCFIIAEIGQNHQGDVEIAKQMIIKAKVGGRSLNERSKSQVLTRRFSN